MSQNHFAQTLLLFRSEDETLTIDLRQPLSQGQRKTLAKMGPAKCFAVITAWNPDGRLQSEPDNSVGNRHLDDALSRITTMKRPVDGVSPDLSHREPSFAAWISEPTARLVSQEFRQIAFFWFDGDRFWLVSSADGSRLPLPLPSDLTDATH